MSTNFRSSKYDNLKAVLIFLVVFGHLLAITSGIAASLLNMVIYIFHMPAFVYVTGKFAKPKKKKIIFFLLLYVVFQMLYTPFLQRFYDPTIKFSLITPQWILWYLMATITYLLASYIIPSSPSLKQKKIGIFISFLISILVGFLPFVGLEFSLSRTLVFFPFFLMGKWEGKGELEKGENENEKCKEKKKSAKQKEPKSANSRPKNGIYNIRKTCIIKLTV